MEGAFPPDAERIEAESIVRAALTGLPADVMLAVDVLGKGAPRRNVPEAQVGMVAFSSLMMEKTEYTASAMGGDASQAFLSFTCASGLIKASVEKSRRRCRIPCTRALTSSSERSARSTRRRFGWRRGASARGWWCRS